MLDTAHDSGVGRANQRTNQRIRTRMAIIDACRTLIRAGVDVTMPEVARQALVSEATAYRYFPDLVTLINEANVGLWPSPGEALQPIAQSTDPIERVTFASEQFLQRIIAYQGAIRAMISASVTRPAVAATRPGFRFTWIEYALAPAETMLAPAHTDTFAHLKQDLAVIVSPEALFTLTDLCGLTPDAAIASLVRLATATTAAALRDLLPERP